MKEKLQILIQTENLTPSGLARRLDVNPPVISHILKGRNQPSYELIRRIVTRFPKINPYWLLGDSDDIYNSTTAQSANETPAQNGQNELFPMSTVKDDEEPFDVKYPASESADIFDLPVQHPSSQNRTDAPEIDRIIIAYKNGTFESLVPKK